MTREERLMPDGVPKWVRIYDDPTTFDRYAVVYTGHYRRNHADWYAYMTLGEDPRGFSQHGESEFQPIDVNAGGWAPALGRKCHLGTRIAFADLPEACQRVATASYRDLWKLGG